MTFQFFWNVGKFSCRTLAYLSAPWLGRDKENSVLVPPGSLIWHSVSTSNTIICNNNVWPYLKTTFSNLIQQRKITEKICGCTGILNSVFYPKNVIYVKRKPLQDFLVQLIHLIDRHKWWYNKRREWEGWTKMYNFTL